MLGADTAAVWAEVRLRWSLAGRLIAPRTVRVSDPTLHLPSVTAYDSTDIVADRRYRRAFPHLGSEGLIAAEGQGRVEDGKSARVMEWLSRSPEKLRPARNGSFPAAMRRIAEAHSVQVSDG